MQNDVTAHEYQMLLEIREQPVALRRVLERYARGGGLNEELLPDLRRWIGPHNAIVIAGSGSSRHAGLAGEILIEDLSGIPVDVEYASEYCYRSVNTVRNPAVIVLSQSGETADTLAALREASSRGHSTLAITNVEGSTMEREAMASLNTLAGVEQAIPATKSFLTQLAVLQLLALFLAREKGRLGATDIAMRLQALDALPAKLHAALPRWEKDAAKVAEDFHSAKTFLYLGRGIHYAIAREGALKLKESSYLHAEGYPAGELKHGPNALVSEDVPLVVLATRDDLDPDSVLRYEKTMQLLADMKQQGARTLVLCNEDDKQSAELATHIIGVPAASEHMLPLLEVVPLQLLAYFLAVAHGVNVDKPRNLVKAVTSE